MIKLEQYDDFIESVFKTVYPFIVKVDAPISISIHKYDRYNLLGHIDPYGNVHLGLATIASRVCNDDTMIKNFILESIVHELTHLDQEIDPKVMKLNKDYAKLIEDQCITQTVSFILKNVDALEQKFKFKINIEMFENRLRPACLGYTRKSLFNAFAMKFEAAYDCVEIIRMMRNAPNIIMRYKDNGQVYKYTIKNNNELNTDVKTFNRLLYKYITTGIRKYDIHLMNNMYYIDIF